jgi:hypothetical protein
VSDYIKKLQKAIRDLHGCESQYLETVEVTETFRGKTVWQGDVEVFQIRGHPKANRAFAWSHVAGTNDQETKYITVLELPPVTSPETAVKAAIMSEIQNAREKEKRR